MSGIGFSELIILFLIGLIVLGPERLPRVANQLGNWIGQARRMTRVMKRQLEDELDLEKTPDINPRAPAATPFAKDTRTPDPVHLPANEDDDSFSEKQIVDELAEALIAATRGPRLRPPRYMSVSSWVRRCARKPIPRRTIL